MPSATSASNDGSGDGVGSMLAAGEAGSLGGRRGRRAGADEQHQADRHGQEGSRARFHAL